MESIWSWAVWPDTVVFLIDAPLLMAVAAVLTAAAGLTAAIFAGITALLRVWMDYQQEEAKATIRQKDKEIRALKRRVSTCEREHPNPP